MHLYQATHIVHRSYADPSLPLSAVYAPHIRNVDSGMMMVFGILAIPIYIRMNEQSALLSMVPPKTTRRTDGRRREGGGAYA